MKKKYIGIIFTLFISVSMACQLSGLLPWETGGQDGQISAEDVAEAATRAANAAATAGALSGQAGDIAGTAAAQGDNPLGSADAATPEINISPGATNLEQKLANIQPDANGNFSLAITDTDLNEFVDGHTGGTIRTEGFAVDNVGIVIDSESATLSGDVQEPLAVPLSVEMRPVVQNGQLHFDVISATAGIFPAPEELLGLIEVTANNELTQALTGLPNNTTLQNVELADGVILITGHMQQ